jgi:hypothetical protein
VWATSAKSGKQKERNELSEEQQEMRGAINYAFVDMFDREWTRTHANGAGKEKNDA